MAIGTNANKRQLQMRIQFGTILLTAVALVADAAALEPVDLVTPLMGTDSEPALSAGNVYPDISRPWGMHSWTPQTGPMANTWFYGYRQTKLRGFRQTHQPSPWMGDYGAFAVFPMTGAPVFDEFSHKAETAKPYFYRVYLADYDTTFEMTPTVRAAMMRVTYPQTDSPLFLVDLIASGREKGTLTVDKAARRIEGRIDCRGGRGAVSAGFANHFVLEFDRAFEVVGDMPPSVGAILRFAPMARGEQVIVRVASSFIDAAQARRNLQELGTDSFEAIAEKGRAEWNALLSRVRVEGGSEARLKTFYTCLYRALLFPRIHWEVDGAGEIVHRSPVADDTIAKGYYYGGTGFWDTFRSLFPLLNFLYPDINAKMTAGLENCWKECGWLPEWSNPGLAKCMIGNNSASVVADAWLSDIREGYDVQELYKALVHGANNVHPNNATIGRAGVKEYNEKGYVPRDVGIRESAARTLEYAYDDWCIARLARALGRPADEVATYEKRAQNWRNVFNPAVGLMCGRASDETFNPSFDKFAWGGDFTEGNSLHYTWSVFHDIAGLMAAMGGREAFVRQLDAIFTLPPKFELGAYKTVIHEMREMQIVGFGQYAHGNQPIQHMLYLYDWAGEPWKTQHWVREALDRLYAPTPDGYCGDEDNGQTSAWYVWSALGCYPVCPGTGEYALGAPLFPRATLSFPSGKTLVVEAPGAETNRYVARLTLDGAESSRNYLTRRELQKGGRLIFTTSSEPVKTRGTRTSDAPYSMSRR